MTQTNMRAFLKRKIDAPDDAKRADSVGATDKSAPEDTDGAPAASNAVTVADGGSRAQAPDPARASSVELDPGTLLQLEHADWAAALRGEPKKPYFARLMAFVGAARRKGAVFPPPHQVFAALDASPLSQVKVCIIGQDPYHGPGQAHGLSFSIADTRGCKFPPSLRNIINECHADPDVPFTRGTACPAGSPGSLMAWARQGVLLLNAVLTVSSGQANSHQGQGWETFTDAVVSALARRPGKGCVFILWGAPAAKACARIDTSRHRVITTSHPSPLSNTKGKQPFTGSRCFSRCNQLLVELAQEPVDWNV